MNTTVSPEPVVDEFVLRDFRFAEGGALPRLRQLLDARRHFLILGRLGRDRPRSPGDRPAPGLQGHHLG